MSVGITWMLNSSTAPMSRNYAMIFRCVIPRERSESRDPPRMRDGSSLLRWGSLAVFAARDDTLFFRVRRVELVEDLLGVVRRVDFLVDFLDAAIGTDPERRA